MVLTMKCSVQVVTAGVLVDRDQSLVGVRQEDGHRVPLEVSCCFFFLVFFISHVHLGFKTVFGCDCFFRLHYTVINLNARKF